MKTRDISFLVPEPGHTTKKHFSKIWEFHNFLKISFPCIYLS